VKTQLGRGTAKLPVTGQRSCARMIANRIWWHNKFTCRRYGIEFSHRLQEFRTKASMSRAESDTQPKSRSISSRDAS
jgi:hypothetical protein